MSKIDTMNAPLSGHAARVLETAEALRAELTRTKSRLEDFDHFVEMIQHRVTHDGAVLIRIKGTLYRVEEAKNSERTSPEKVAGKSD